MFTRKSGVVHIFLYDLHVPLKLSLVLADLTLRGLSYASLVLLYTAVEMSKFFSRIEIVVRHWLLSWYMVVATTVLLT